MGGIFNPACKGWLDTFASNNQCHYDVRWSLLIFPLGVIIAIIWWWLYGKDEGDFIIAGLISLFAAVVYPVALLLLGLATIIVVPGATFAGIGRMLVQTRKHIRDRAQRLRIEQANKQRLLDEEQRASSPSLDLVRAAEVEVNTFLAQSRRP